MSYSIPTNIIPNNEEARLKKLRHYEILDTPAETAFDTIALLAAEVFDVSNAFITFVDEDRVFFKANISNLKSNEVPRKESLCSLAILENGITVFNDLHTFPEFILKPYISAKMEIRFYAGAPLKTSEGYHLGTVCVIDSIPRSTNEKQLKMLKMLSIIVMEKLESRIATRKTLRAHDDRLHMLVHDLKNPMTSILLQSELIDRTVKTEVQAALIARKIHQQSKNIVDSLDHILSDARSQHDAIKLQQRKVDLKAILEETARNFGIMLDNKNQKLHLQINEPIEIYADEEKLKDIFENLISNAMKYSEPNKEITISTKTENNKVIVSVKDQGLGLLPTDIEKLFVKFARLSSIPTGRERSNGLGLSIVKMLVDLHKGKVWAESKGKNMGSTFFVELPLKY